MSVIKKLQLIDKMVEDSVPQSSPMKYNTAQLELVVELLKSMDASLKRIADNTAPKAINKYPVVGTTGTAGIVPNSLTEMVKAEHKP